MVESDDERFLRYGSELATAVEAALPAWVRASVERFVPAGSLDAEVDAASDAAVAEVGGRLRDLLGCGLDDQWTNPLSVLRAAAAYPTRVLRDHGVPPVDRDDHARRLHPDDYYDLTPGAFADFGADVHERGITWGAAKAHLHLQRRKQA